MMLIGGKLLLLLLLPLVLLPLVLLGLCCVRGRLCWCSARLAHAGAFVLGAVRWMLLLLQLVLLVLLGVNARIVAEPDVKSERTS